MLIRIIQGIHRRFRSYWLQYRGVRCIGRNWLQQIEIPRNHFDIEIHNGVALDRGVTLLATGHRLDYRRIVIGAGTYVNRHTMIDASESIQVGANCMIGPFCYITDHDHGTAIGSHINDQPLVGSPVRIDDDVWIGAHAVILKGVHIGYGAVVGAGAVVTRSVPSYAVFAGVPATQISIRK
jgi:acetyltransferase-like isoleucine patch superfamily enzyme